MPINMSLQVYEICQDTFGRTAVFTSATGNSYSGTNRGIYGSEMLGVPLEDGSLITDQRTIFDIRTDEYSPLLPVQGDTIAIPADPVTGLPDLGSFQIVDVFHNGGGEITLQLRKLVGS